MKIQQISDSNDFFELQKNFLRKDSKTNLFFLPSEVERLVAEGSLFSFVSSANLFIFERKEGEFMRIYHVLNDLSDTPVFDLPFPLVSEVLFRGNDGEPTEEIGYLTKSGFEINLRRDQYAASANRTDVLSPVFANTIEDVKEGLELFNRTFDRFSGDYVPLENADSIFRKKNMLVQYDDKGIPAGFLETEIKGKCAWVSHLSVKEQYRGQGVSKVLMAMYESNAIAKGARRLMLWVQSKNEKAVKLYSSLGFSYTNKSTISLIKK